MIRTRRWKLVHDPSGVDRDELYDLKQDTHGLRSCSGGALHASVDADLREALLACRARPKPTMAPSNTSPTEEEAFE